MGGSCVAEAPFTLFHSGGDVSAVCISRAILRRWPHQNWFRPDPSTAHGHDVVTCLDLNGDWEVDCSEFDQKRQVHCTPTLPSPAFASFAVALYSFAVRERWL